MIFEREAAITTEGRGGKVMTEDGMFDFEQGERAKRTFVFARDKPVDGMTVQVMNEVHP